MLLFTVVWPAPLAPSHVYSILLILNWWIYRSFICIFCLAPSKVQNCGSYYDVCMHPSLIELETRKSYPCSLTHFRHIQCVKPLSLFVVVLIRSTQITYLVVCIMYVCLLLFWMDRMWYNKMEWKEILSPNLINIAISYVLIATHMQRDLFSIVWLYWHSICF